MFQEQTYLNRINKLKNQIKPNTLYLFSNPSHIQYLTGFNFLVHSEREAFFVCSDKVTALIHTSFSPISNFSFLENLPGSFPSQLKQHIEKFVEKTEVKNLLYDDKTLYVSELNAINEISDLKTEAILDNPIIKLISQKDKDEILLIKNACKITKKVFDSVKAQIFVGISELEIAKLIKTEFEKNNVTELAFPTIIAFGANAAKPHHQPGIDKLEENTSILIDMGAKINGYCSDMTRTFWFGQNMSEQFLKIEKIVVDAYNLAVQECQKHNQESIQAQNIDNAARTHIANQGFGDNFIHTTGHGLGLDIHEYPSLNWNNHDEITTGMTITIEPGIYLEGEIGYRHENTFLTTAEGVEVLTE